MREFLSLMNIICPVSNHALCSCIHSSVVEGFLNSSVLCFAPTVWYIFNNIGPVRVKAALFYILHVKLVFVTLPLYIDREEMKIERKKHTNIKLL